MNLLRPRSAFTLIELLAVISIIGVLAAILIPTVGAVRKSGLKATGLANIRQLHALLTTYTQDHQGVMPLGGASDLSGRNGLSWVNHLLPYVGSPELATVNLNDRWDAPPNPVFMDPGIELEGERDRIFGATTDATWGFGYNIQPLLPESAVHLAKWSDDPPPQIRLNAVTEPSRRMLFASAFDWFVNGAEENRAYHRYGIDQAICVYFDGHAAVVSKTDYDKAWRNPAAQ
jgi:prepilin-type N-terminal cleavage/methylation domain-containing protein